MTTFLDKRPRYKVPLYLKNPKEDETEHLFDTRGDVRVKTVKNSLVIADMSLTLIGPESK